MIGPLRNRMTQEVPAHQIVPNFGQQELAGVCNRTPCEHVSISFDRKLCGFLRGLAGFGIHAGNLHFAHRPGRNRECKPGLRVLYQSRCLSVREHNVGHYRQDVTGASKFFCDCATHLYQSIGCGYLRIIVFIPPILVTYPRNEHHHSTEQCDEINGGHSKSSTDLNC